MSLHESEEIRPDQVAMLFKGTEVYGIGTIIKLFALHAPEIRFVAFREGYLTEWLRDHGHEVLRPPGPAHVSLRPGLGRLALLSTVRAARRAARDLQPWLEARGIRLVHTHWFAQQLVAGFLRRQGFLSVWQINDYVDRGALLPLRRLVHRRIARWGADLLLPASDFVGTDWEGSGVPQRTVHNAALPAARSATPPPERPLRCIAVGRMAPIKGLHVAVEAVGRVRDAGIDLRLEIYGGPLEDNPYADRLRRMIREGGHPEAIQLRGFREDLRTLHGRYHFGIQCRLDPEPCSLWVCEAQFDGLPLLASASGGTPELVQEGVTGLLYRPGDVDELTEKILQLTRNPETLREMQDANLARSRPYFSGERFVRETFTAYLEAVTGSARRDAAGAGNGAGSPGAGAEPDR